MGVAGDNHPASIGPLAPPITAHAVAIAALFSSRNQRRLSSLWPKAPLPQWGWWIRGLKMPLLPAIPTLTHYSDIVSDILSVWHTPDMISGIYSDVLSDIRSCILSGIYSDILFGIYFGILSDIDLARFLAYP